MDDALDVVIALHQRCGRGVGQAVHAAVIEYVTVNGALAVMEHAAQAGRQSVAGRVKKYGEGKVQIAEEVEFVGVGDVVQDHTGGIVIAVPVGTSFVDFGAVRRFVVGVITVVMPFVLCGEGGKSQASYQQKQSAQGQLHK